MHVRGAGERARSLKVKGEEIYKFHEHVFLQMWDLRDLDILDMVCSIYKRRNMEDPSSQHLQAILQDALPPVCLELVS